MSNIYTKIFVAIVHIIWKFYAILTAIRLQNSTRRFTTLHISGQNSNQDSYSV